MMNGLGQTLLKITCPGIPDFYQGCELWNRNLVDPDNRRPVDFQIRTEALRAFKEADSFEREGTFDKLISEWPDGRIKLYTIWKALGCRRQYPALFRDGEFIPLPAVGERSDHIVSFLRRRGEEQAIVAIPRWVSELHKCKDGVACGAFWKETNLQLPQMTSKVWRNVFTGKTVESVPGSDPRAFPAGELFADFPVALLISTENTSKETISYVK
jgi:(1->4)-alpha-D-glucan 1-alpha-D-glucosylmutase